MPKMQYKVKGETFEVDDRYEVKKKIGAGAYGLLCAATDKKDEESQVAVKKIKDAFEDAIDCKRTLREVRLLQHFTHENILNLRDIMLPPAGSIDQWKDIYLVLELMDTDLHYIIHSKQALTDDHIQYFIYQILRGLKAIHSASVLHRDLKPNNLLVNKNCDLKICDFGLARGVDGSVSAALTEYVVTRWYRAPELLVENAQYDMAIDIWSVGCILAECLGRKALLPGKDYLQQLRLIIETLGQPSASDLAVVENPSAVDYINALPKKPKVPFETLYPNANPLAIDLLNPTPEETKQQHKLKRLVQSPNSYFMDVKCPGCVMISTVFSHAQTVVLCANCSQVLCRPTGGKARLTEGCSFRKKKLAADHGAHLHAGGRHRLRLQGADR